MTRFVRLGLLAALSLGSLVACGDDDGGTPSNNPDASPTDPDATPAATTVDVTADITTDTMWTADKTYILKNGIFVKDATLTIEAGTVVKGDMNSALIITTTGKIAARGTATAPIVFTSAQPEGARAPGDWGGVVLLGKAPINVAGGSTMIEGFDPNDPASEVAVYGGADTAHDCGDLVYVRIEFAGFELVTDNELNGLTVGGCGSATELDYIQVHKGLDDGIEFFGGTANLKHAIMSQGEDDGLDWDQGWSGKAQFIIVQQGPLSDNGFECDNLSANNDATPRSNPTIYNVSIIGDDAAPGGAVTHQGMLLRRGTAGTIVNLLMAHVSDFPVDIDGTATVTQAEAGALTIKNSIFFDNGNQATWNDTTDDDGGLVERTFFMAAEHDNLETDPMVDDAMNRTAPAFKPGAGSPALTASNAATPPGGGFFDVTATFIGAVGATDWTAGWTAYPQD